jgi:hypothetical protein
LTRLVGAAMSALGLTLGQFAIIAAPVAVVVGALVAVTSAMGESAKKAAEAEQRLVDTRKRILDLDIANIELARSRTAEENRQIAQDQQDAITLTREALATAELRLADLQRQAAEQLVNPFANPFDLGNLDAQIGVEKQAIEDLNVKIIELGEQAANTVQVLGPEIDSREVERQAIEAATAAREASNKQILATAEDARNDFLELARALDGTEEQARKRVQSLYDENIALEAAIRAIYDSGVQTKELGEQIEKYNQLIEENERDIDSLTDSIIPLLDAREKEKKAAEELKAALEAMPAAGEKVRDAQAKVDEANNKLAESYASSAATITKINTDLAAKEADILSKSRDKAADIAENYGIQRKEAEEDLALELLKIQRKLKVSLLDAVGSRDAVAAEQARVAAAAQQQDLKENTTVETKRKADAYKRQLRDLAKSTADQIVTARAGANAAIAIERQKQTIEVQARQQALNFAVQQYQMFLSQLQALAAETGRQVLIPQTTTLTTQQARDQGFLPSRDSGGPIEKGRTYRINGEPITFGERAYAHGLNKGGGGGGITINGYGMNKKQVLREVEKALTDYDRGLKAG